MTRNSLTAVVSVLILLSLSVGNAWSPTPVKNDPHVRMPGTQPAPEGNVSLEGPNRCLNCHSGYDQAVEPGYNWQGSMMAQAARDFLFWACMTVAAQDSIWAVGNPNACDICLRCHFPKGWVEGRSDPVNASLMTGDDYDGVQCDFCHRAFDPFFEATFTGTREPGDRVTYWDETNASGTPSQPAAEATYLQDFSESAAIAYFNGAPFYGANRHPASLQYKENASGQYFLGANAAKRASFADAEARHQMFYSRYHKSKYQCATCHDVSNPVLANLGQDGSAPLTTETLSAHAYYHVERTFSEFMLSDYGQQGGAPGVGPFAPDVFATSSPDNAIARCQDCHMRDGVGAGANKRGAPVRPYDSVEHPNSGQPIHDLTGGNMWVSYILASTVPGAANYDSLNDALLNQGAAVLTLDLTQGQGVNAGALLAGVGRAREQLELAASIRDVSYNPSNGSLDFTIQNQTGHKLISGFPEGRRMFINVKAFAGGQLTYEVNPYDFQGGTIKGLSYNYQNDPDLPPPAPLAGGEAHVDALVYETHPSSALTGEDETFHFALATERYKDNRIPPKGFRIEEASARLSVPRWHGEVATDYFTAEEYAGGYDDVSLDIAPGADYVEVNLYYQTTSREYIEFLRDEINGSGNLTLPEPPPSGEPQSYVIQGADPNNFFAGLKAWGDTIWAIWKHNMNVDGARPVLMAKAAVGAAPPPCEPPVPELLSAVPASHQVTLTWSDESADAEVIGYRVYYDQAGKSQLIAEIADAAVTTFVDTGLLNGEPYCYKVTAFYAGCESAFSNVLCATPNGGGQLQAGVNSLQTGRWIVTGKGKSQTTTFELTSAFLQGDGVVVRARVVDTGAGLPVQNAVVELQISGPQSVSLATAPSGADGIAETTWQTQSPNKRGQGGTTPGSYTVTTVNVVADGYAWDGVKTSADFTVTQ